MEKGVNKYWTPEKEEHYKRALDSCPNFGARALIMLMRDVLKYDGRSKEGKRAISKARLRLGTASDDDLANMVTLESRITGGYDPRQYAEKLEDLKRLRAKINQKGIKRSELECQ